MTRSKKKLDLIIKILFFDTLLFVGTKDTKSFKLGIFKNSDNQILNTILI